MHTVLALLCFVVVIHWLIFPYPSGLLHWHCGNLAIAPVPAKQPWWIWINTSCEFIMNDCKTTTKQSTTKPCAYFLGYIGAAPMTKMSSKWDFKMKIRFTWWRSTVNSPYKGQWRGALMISFDLRLNKRLSRQSWGWWFETPLHPLWCYCNEGLLFLKCVIYALLLTLVA